MVLQIGWFILQCMSRKIDYLVTVAFSSLNIVTYVFWWNKSLDVQCAIKINVDGSAQARVRI